MSSFDPIAVAVDWLDAYRAADLSIAQLYAPDAALECSCSGLQTLIGREAIMEYWRGRFAAAPAGELQNLHLEGNFVALSYMMPKGVVQAILQLNDAGEIVRSRCGPLRPVPAGSSNTNRHDFQ